MTSLTHAMFEGSPEALFLLDANFRVVDLNEEAARLSGNSPESKGSPLPFTRLGLEGSVWENARADVERTGNAQGTVQVLAEQGRKCRYRLSGPHEGFYLFGLIKVDRLDPVGLPIDDLSGLSTELVIRALQYQQEALSKEKQALTDALTQVGNRRLFDSEIARMHREHLLDGSFYSILMIDVDHFKTLNDSNGHLVGDQVLRELGTLLKTACRPGDIVARVGGEEFAVLLPGIGSSEAARVAERIRGSIEGLNPCGISVTASLGVASQGGSSVPFNTLLLQADAALYGAKANGRNQVSTGDTQAEAA
ncbi:MAG: sensor domain-containing diguanylate cyclase [Armatimonadetes bacterium]|nr:sensor domain-containing diguanylate cyclase [Armatimonadota bacterium]